MIQSHELEKDDRGENEVRFGTSRRDEQTTEGRKDFIIGKIVWYRRIKKFVENKY